MNGIHALIREIPESSLTPLPCEDMERRQLSLSQDMTLTVLNLLAPWPQASQRPEL